MFLNISNVDLWLTNTFKVTQLLPKISIPKIRWLGNHLTLSYWLEYQYVKKDFIGNKGHQAKGKTTLTTFKRLSALPSAKEFLQNCFIYRCFHYSTLKGTQSSFPDKLKTVLLWLKLLFKLHSFHYEAI